MLHLIPEDDAPHAPSTECGCGPQLRLVPYGASRREALVHNDQRKPDRGFRPHPSWEKK